MKKVNDYAVFVMFTCRLSVLTITKWIINFNFIYLWHLLSCFFLQFGWWESTGIWHGQYGNWRQLTDGFGRALASGVQIFGCLASAKKKRILRLDLQSSWFDNGEIQPYYPRKSDVNHPLIYNNYSTDPSIYAYVSRWLCFFSALNFHCFSLLDMRVWN